MSVKDSMAIYSVAVERIQAGAKFMLALILAMLSRALVWVFGGFAVIESYHHVQYSLSATGYSPLPRSTRILAPYGQCTK